MDGAEAEIQTFHKLFCENNGIKIKRNNQSIQSMYRILHRKLITSISNDPLVQEEAKRLIGNLSVPGHPITPSTAAGVLFDIYHRRIHGANNNSNDDNKSN